MVKSSKVKSFWIAFFAILFIVATICGTYHAITMQNALKYVKMSVIDDENVYKIGMENAQKQSLYLVCDSLKNIDANLGKVSVSNDTSHQAELLTDVAICASEVSCQLANLPIETNDVLAQCEKFANQTQDYATYLVGKIASANQLQQDERCALKNLQRVAKNMYDLFQNYAESDSAMFITNGTGVSGVGDLTTMLNSAKDDAFTYEKLIYDGPFSDSVEQKHITCAKKISHKQGSDIVKKHFGENKFVREIAQKCPLYVYQTQKGEVTLTSDGRVVEYEATQVFDGKKSLDGKQCIAKAEEFCQALGYNVKGIWVSNVQDYVTYVNCATVVDGVIVYPELIKVAVDTSNGQIVGLEAKSYLTNHKERQVDFGSTSQTDCQKHLDESLRVTNVAKSLIEIKGKEYFAYEFECTDGTNQYYVYVDSHTGKEVQIFKVIANTEGHTVM